MHIILRYQLPKLYVPPVSVGKARIWLSVWGWFVQKLLDGGLGKRGMALCARGWRGISKVFREALAMRVHTFG